MAVTKIRSSKDRLIRLYGPGTIGSRKENAVAFLSLMPEDSEDSLDFVEVYIFNRETLISLRNDIDHVLEDVDSNEEIDDEG